MRKTIQGAKAHYYTILAMLLPAQVSIVIAEGFASVIRGQATARTLVSIHDTCEAAGIEVGLIRVTETPDGPRVRFHGRFDEATRQRCRNLWLLES